MALMRSMSMAMLGKTRIFSWAAGCHSRAMSMPEPRPSPRSPRRSSTRHWRRTLRLTGVLLLLWFAVTFGIAFFARELDFDFFGWPFSFWVASQGALLVYLLLVGVYALAMRRLDALEGQETVESPAPAVPAVPGPSA